MGLTRSGQLFVAAAVVILAGCDGNNGCLTSDSVKELAQFRVGVTEYAVYLRTSGLQEKESFFELYRNSVTFDECGKTASPVLSQDHVDSSKGFLHKLAVHGERIEIVYTDDEHESQEASELTVDVS